MNRCLVPSLAKRRRVSAHDAKKYGAFVRRLFQRQRKRRSFVSGIHGVVCCAFASAVAISSKEGARRMWSGPLPPPMTNIRESGEKAR